MNQLLRSFLRQPIAFHRPLVDATGSVLAALMLSQALYWRDKGWDRDGWFWKTQEEWQAETGMSRYEQETARKKLRKTGFWEEELRGAPARLYFRVDEEGLFQKLAIQYGGFPHTSMGESNNLVWGNPANITKTTSEITTEITSDDDRASPQKSSGGDRDGRWLLQALRDTGLFAYMDSDAMRLAAALEEDYTDDQLIVGKGKLVEAHKKQIGEGKRGITAPLAYLRAILMRGLDESGSAGKGNGRGRPAEIDWDAEMERYLREHPIDSEPIDPDEITF